jgi:hypothetical protein
MSVDTLQKFSTGRVARLFLERIVDCLRRPANNGAMRHILLASMLGLATAASAGGVGYAKATGYFKKDSRPTLYQPLNLLDGKETTVWCSPSADPLNEVLTFGFTTPTRIDEVRITTGNNFSEATWKEFARAQKLAFIMGKQTQIFTLDDERGPQLRVFDKPITTTRLSLEVRDQYASDDPDQPVCISDIVFISEGKPLNGAWMAPKLKYDKNLEALMGTWFAGYEGGPDRFLAFHFDGTFRYSFEPFDTTKNAPKVIEGRYDVQGGKLVLEVGGKKFAPKYTIDPSKKAGLTLGLDGDLPPDIKGPFRSVP